MAVKILIKRTFKIGNMRAASITDKQPQWGYETIGPHFFGKLAKP